MGVTVSTDSRCTPRKLPQELYAELDDYIDGLCVTRDDPRRTQTLSQSLRKAQMIFGYLPEEVQLHVADRYRVSHAMVSGVVSFYNYFTTTPKGKVQVNVCLGTACYVNGADKVLHACEETLKISSGEVTADGQFSVESLRCLGVCGLAPVVSINDKIHAGVRPKQVPDILEPHLKDAYGKDDGDRA
jgi:NADH:ubiquinone oxidoreductase subunit E